MASFLEVFLPLFNRHLYYGKFLKCLFFDWNEKQSEITLKKRVSIHIWTFTQVAYITFQTAYLTLGTSAVADKFIGALILAMYFNALMFRFEFEPNFISMQILNRLISGLGNILQYFL